jgi:REP element-mobilizing transposase RayT
MVVEGKNMSRNLDRQSARLKGFDYSNEGRYAVTICTQGREHTFGEIKAERMSFSHVGRIAREYWYSLPDRFPGVCLDAFVLMPNHVHGIVIIPSTHLALENIPERFQPSMQTLMQERYPELQDAKPPTLGTMVRAYKGAATYQIHQSGEKSFRGQESYWSSILFSNAALQRARRYIYENPQNWEKDKFYRAKK